MIIKAAPGTDPRTADGRTLPRLLLDRARAYPAHACMREKKYGVWVTYTWSDVSQRVQATARGLAALGLRRGDVVAILSENIVESFWTEYAALSLGARIVCAYPDLTAQELLYILGHSEAKVLMAEDQEQVDKFLAVKNVLPGLTNVIYVDPRGLWNYREPQLISYGDLVAAGAVVLEEPDRLDQSIESGHQNDVAVICYTSGTTGQPKGAMLSHRFLLECAYRIMAAHGVRPHAEYLSYISPAWATEQFMGFALGLLAPLVVNFAEKPDTVKRDLREVGPEYLLFTPRQWEMLATDVQAQMLDAGAIRQKLYSWAVKTGTTARRSDAGFLDAVWRSRLPSTSCCGTSATIWACRRRGRFLAAVRAYRPKFSLCFTRWACRCGTSTAAPSLASSRRMAPAHSIQRRWANFCPAILRLPRRSKRGSTKADSFVSAVARFPAI